MSKEKGTLKALQEKLGGVLRLRDEKQKELSRADEIKQLEAEIAAAKKREEENALQVVIAKVAEAEVKVQDLLRRREELSGEIEAINKEIEVERQAVWDGLQKPLEEGGLSKWHQITAKHFVVMIETVREPISVTPMFQTDAMARVGEVSSYKTDYEERTREQLVPAIPDVIRMHETKHGWKVKEGQTLILDEKLDWANAVLERACEIPLCLDPTYVVLEYRVPR